MLKIELPECESWDEVKGEFVFQKKTVLQLEHSLVSISKWESKWHKPFLGKQDKTVEETLDYVRCMTLTQNVDPSIYRRITRETLNQIEEYIADPMTATWFSKDNNRKRNKEIITAEIIYYWMIALNIPFECQKWHLNKLLTLVQVCNIKNSPNKKMSKKDILKSNTSLNAARRKALNSKG